MLLPIVHLVSMMIHATFLTIDLFVLYICFIFANKMIALWKQ